jgi:glycosyltransferase involved in cell wall biosynthesis
MRIGWISASLPYLPCRGGFKLIGGNLIAQLSKRHEIDLISLLHEGDEDHLDWAKQFCVSVQGIPARGISLPLRVASFVSGYLAGRNLNRRAEIAAAMRPGLESRRWDVLHVEGGFAGGLLPADLRVASVLSIHDSEVLRAQEMLKCALSARDRLNYTVRKLYQPRYERAVYPRFGRCVMVAERDAAFNRTLVPKANFSVVPLGIDLSYYHPMPVQKEPATLVFHGHLGYPPNVQAAVEFARDVFPRIRSEMPSAIFHLVGASPTAEIQALAATSGIKLSPDLPDLRNALSSASVYVCAVRFGSGMKNKILEAMALGLPIVAYAGSAAGIDCIPGKDLEIADDPEEFAAKVLRLLRNPAEAESLADHGKLLVQEKYSWDARAHAYEEIYQQVIDESGSRQSSDRVRV